MNNLITIDGPAASGKTSLSRRLAHKLGWSWMSTGVFYRGMAWLSLLKQKNSENDIVELIRNLCWKVQLDKDNTRFIYEGKDIKEIYSNEVDERASMLARYPAVRKSLRPFQRECYSSEPKGLVAEGRDCGTVVFPKALLKVYLTANEGIRARRRADQRRDFSFNQVMSLQKKRDKQDIQRKASPLRRPEGALVIDAGQNRLEPTVEQVYKKYQELMKASLE